jgi:hypothetical protein
MPQKNKNKSMKKKDQVASGQMISVRSGRFLLEMPVPRLPRWLGTPNLSASNSVYPRVDLDVPIACTNVSFTAGSLAEVFSIDNTAIPNFATRFGATFKEFAIVGARLELRLTSATTPQGVLLAYIDELSNASPTATSVDYAHAEVPVVGSVVDSTGSIHKISWMAKSYADLTWDPIGTAGTVAYLKIFGNVANTGLNAATAGALMITGAYSVCFRGYI